MFDNVDDFKKKALDNKANLKFKNISKSYHIYNSTVVYHMCNGTEQ